MSGKLLMKLDAVSQLLQQHTADHYAFLDAPANGRNRTTYYATLARLLFMEDTPQRFRAFVLPLHQVRECNRGMGHSGVAMLDGWVWRAFVLPLHQVGPCLCQQERRGAERCCSVGRGSVREAQRLCGRCCHCTRCGNTASATCASVRKC